MNGPSVNKAKLARVDFFLSSPCYCPLLMPWPVENLWLCNMRISKWKQRKRKKSPWSKPNFHISYKQDWNIFQYIRCRGKGQLISKCLFRIFNSPKKRTKKFDSSRFLGVLKTPKRRFEIDWPLKALRLLNFEIFSMSYRYFSFFEHTITHFCHILQSLHLLKPYV